MSSLYNSYDFFIRLLDIFFLLKKSTIFKTFHLFSYSHFFTVDYKDRSHDSINSFGSYLVRADPVLYATACFYLSSALFFIRQALLYPIVLCILC